MDIIGAIAGTLTLVGYLPQTIKTIRTRHTKDLSLATFLIIGLSAFFWTIYGIGERVPSIWVTNGVVTICSTIILSIKISQKES